MKKKIYRIAPCPNYDVERVESWLQDMAKDGWVLDGEGSVLNILAFQKTEPQLIRYRLEPKPKGAMDDETPSADMQEMCREYGWEFVRQFDYFFIYRAISPDAREMNTDMEVQAVSLRSVKRQALFRILYLTFLWSGSTRRLFAQSFRLLLTSGPLYYLGLLSLEVWIFTEIIVRTLHIHRLQRKLKHNTPLDHSKPWKKGAAFHRTGKIFWWVFYLFLLAYMITSCTANLADGRHMADYTGDPPFVTMIDLCEEEDASYTILNPTLSNAVVEKSNLLTPKYMEWREEAEIVTAGGETISGSLDITYYETVSPWLARNLAQDLLEYAQDRHSHFRYLDEPKVNADFSAVYAFVNGADPVILIQNGNYVIQADFSVTSSSGKNLLSAWLELQMERMK